MKIIVRKMRARHFYFKNMTSDVWVPYASYDYELYPIAMIDYEYYYKIPKKDLNKYHRFMGTLSNDPKMKLDKLLLFKYEYEAHEFVDNILIPKHIEIKLLTK